MVAALGFLMASCDICAGGSGDVDVGGGSLIGTWLASEENDGYTMTFTGSMADGGYVEFAGHPYHGSYTAEWSVNGNELTIVGYSWTMHIGVYIFSINGGILTRVHMGSEEILIYTRVKQNTKFNA